MDTVYFMASPMFLYQDDSWRTVSIQWTQDFNQKLAMVSGTAAPRLSTRFETAQCDKFRNANDNALRLLDSRQSDTQGLLPSHICGITFGGWSDAEDALISMQNAHANNPRSDEEYVFLDNLLFAWRCIFKFNLANLSLLDSGAPAFMKMMAQGQLEETVTWLEKAVAHEPKLELALDGLPSPTRQVRFAVQHALNGQS